MAVLLHGKGALVDWSHGRAPHLCLLQGTVILLPLFPPPSVLYPVVMPPVSSGGYP